MARRIGEYESRFRNANEKIETAVLRPEADAPSVPFVCECGRRECYLTLRFKLTEYERGREHHVGSCAVRGMRSRGLVSAESCSGMTGT